jgi:hypothetical protein
LQRNENAVAGGEGVQRENPQRRRAVNQHHVKTSAIEHGFECEREALQMIFQPRDLDVGGAQVHFARQYFQAFAGRRLDFFKQRTFAQQNAIRAGTFNFFQTDAAGGVGLRVEVEKQNALAERGEAGGEIDGGGGFSYATFLVGDGDDFGWHFLIK